MIPILPGSGNYLVDMYDAQLESDRTRYDDGDAPELELEQALEDWKEKRDEQKI